MPARPLPHLFSHEGSIALVKAMGQRPLLAFDFDGTLAPIVSRPEEARVPDHLAQLLQRLSERLTVAIITGRSIADVQSRLGFAPHHVVGNHGAEDPLRHSPSASDSAALSALRQRLVAKAAALAAAGVSVEDKRYSMALHYRLAHDHEAARETIDSVLEGLDQGLNTYGGKCVVNIVDARAPHKGDAVLRLLRHTGCTTAVFAGDDLNDESVFEVAGPDWLTVRIGLGSTPTKARFFLEGQDEVSAFLTRLLNEH